MKNGAFVPIPTYASQKFLPRRPPNTIKNQTMSRRYDTSTYGSLNQPATPQEAAIRYTEEQAGRVSHQQRKSLVKESGELALRLLKFRITDVIRLLMHLLLIIYLRLSCS